VFARHASPLIAVWTPSTPPSYIDDPATTLAACRAAFNLA